MALLHDPQARAAIKQRLSTLQAGAKRRWGKMSVDQMLNHVNRTLEAALGRRQVAQRKLPLPKFAVKFLVLNAPWPKGAPSAPEYVVGERHDFDTERVRCLGLIDEFVSRPVDATWPEHFSFGTVSGTEYSKLHAKHLDHHLRQFSA